MSAIEPQAIASAAIRSIVVPSAIYDASVRANLHLMDLTVFDKLRKIASLEDIAAFAALNDQLCVGGEHVATSKLKDIMSLGIGKVAEFNVVFEKMAKTEEVSLLAFKPLQEYADPFSKLLQMRVDPSLAVTVADKSMRNTLGGPASPNEDLPYQLKTSGSNVFIVVGSGFDEYVGAPLTKEEVKTFIRDFLKLCTGLFSPSEVAQHPLFKTFLYTLAD